MEENRRPQTILVVDDDPDIRHYATLVLEQHGYTVLTAADGVSALGLLNANQQIDLLFTDIVMPGLDGIETARRALLQLPRLKVLLASGYATGVGAACRLLRKPYRPQQLACEVAAALAA